MANDLQKDSASPQGGEAPSKLTFNDTSSSASEVNDESKIYEVDDDDAGTPFIQDVVYTKLPDILRRTTSQFNDKRQRDIFLTGALTVFSGLMPTTTGVYDGRKVWAPLCSWVIAPPASGKGCLRFARDLGSQVQKAKRNESTLARRKWKAEKAMYDAKSKKASPGSIVFPPDEPPSKSLFIPANTSSAKVIQQLRDNDGCGIIIESEADTLRNSVKQDWGVGTDLIRNFFHHETITYSRKGKDGIGEEIEIDSPRVALGLGSTPNQVKGLIESSENGLFSRFIFYTFDQVAKWNSVAPTGKLSITEIFADFACEVHEMHNYLITYPTVIGLTADQWGKFDSKYRDYLNKETYNLGNDISGTVKRLGLIQFRICMILSTIRKHEGRSTAGSITCTDEDFATAEMLSEVYLRHATSVYKTMPKAEGFISNAGMRRFLEVLPLRIDFTKSDAESIGQKIGFPDRTVRYYLNRLCTNGSLEKRGHGLYHKKV